MLSIHFSKNLPVRLLCSDKYIFLILLFNHITKVKYKILYTFIIFVIPAYICAQNTLKFDPILQVIKESNIDESNLKIIAPHLKLFEYTGDLFNDSLQYLLGLTKWHADFPDEEAEFFKQIISREDFAKLMNDHYLSIKQQEEELFQKYKKIIDEKGYINDLSIIATHIPAFGSLPEKKQDWINKYPYEYRAVLYNEKKKPGQPEEENAAKEKLKWIKENDSLRYKQIIFNK